MPVSASWSSRCFQLHDIPSPPVGQNAGIPDSSLRAGVRVTKRHSNEGERNMGADYLQTSVPDADITTERHLMLLKVVDEVHLPDMPEWLDDLADWKAELKAVVARLAEGMSGRRDVGCDHSGDVPLLVTGGMSWGDDPTEAFGDFDKINNCEPLRQLLSRWAKEDAGLGETEQPRKIKVAVYCEGGVVTGVSTDAECDVEVLVCDYDEAGELEDDFDTLDARKDAYEASLSFPDGTTFDDFAEGASVVY